MNGLQVWFTRVCLKFIGKFFVVIGVVKFNSLKYFSERHRQIELAYATNHSRLEKDLYSPDSKPFIGLFPGVQIRTIDKWSKLDTSAQKLFMYFFEMTIHTFKVN